MRTKKHYYWFEHKNTVLKLQPKLVLFLTGYRRKKHHDLASRLDVLFYCHHSLGTGCYVLLLALIWDLKGHPILSTPFLRSRVLCIGSKRASLFLVTEFLKSDGRTQCTYFTCSFASSPLSPPSRTLGNMNAYPSESDHCMNSAACRYSTAAATAQTSRRSTFFLTTTAREDFRNAFPNRKLKKNGSSPVISNTCNATAIDGSNPRFIMVESHPEKDHVPNQRDAFCRCGQHLCASAHASHYIDRAAGLPPNGGARLTPTPTRR